MKFSVECLFMEVGSCGNAEDKRIKIDKIPNACKGVAGENSEKIKEGFKR